MAPLSPLKVQQAAFTDLENKAASTGNTKGQVLYSKIAGILATAERSTQRQLAQAMATHEAAMNALHAKNEELEARVKLLSAEKLQAQKAPPSEQTLSKIFQLEAELSTTQAGAEEATSKAAAAAKDIERVKLDVAQAAQAVIDSIVLELHEAGEKTQDLTDKIIQLTHISAELAQTKIQLVAQKAKADAIEHELSRQQIENGRLKNIIKQRCSTSPSVPQEQAAAADNDESKREIATLKRQLAAAQADARQSKEAHEADVTAALEEKTRMCHLLTHERREREREVRDAASKGRAEEQNRIAQALLADHTSFSALQKTLTTNCDGTQDPTNLVLNTCDAMMHLFMKVMEENKALRGEPTRFTEALFAKGSAFESLYDLLQKAGIQIPLDKGNPAELVNTVVEHALTLLTLAQEQSPINTPKRMNSF